MHLVAEVERALELGCVAELPLARRLGEKTRCDPQHFALAAVLGCGAALLLTSAGHSLLLFAVGFLVPLLNVLRTLGRQTEPEARKWLVYWLAFGALFAAGSGPLALGAALPFFRLALAAALGLLYCPAYRFGEQLHARLLRPLWAQYRRRLGETLALAQEDRAKPKKH